MDRAIIQTRKSDPPVSLEEEVKQFAKCFFGPQNKDNIMRVWCKHKPVGTIGAIDAMDNIFRTLLYGTIDISINPNSIEIFRGQITMRIQRSDISTDLLNILSRIEDKRMRDKFFGNVVLIGMSGTYELRSFRFNELFAAHVNRIWLAKNIIYKALMIGLTTEGGRYYLDMIQILLASLHNIAFVTHKMEHERTQQYEQMRRERKLQKQKLKDNEFRERKSVRIENADDPPKPNTKREWNRVNPFEQTEIDADDEEIISYANPVIDHEKSGLLGVIELLRDPGLFRVLCIIQNNINKQSSNKRSNQDQDTTNHNKRHKYRQNSYHDTSKTSI